MVGYHAIKCLKGILNTNEWNVKKGLTPYKGHPSMALRLFFSIFKELKSSAVPQSPLVPLSSDGIFWYQKALLPIAIKKMEVRQSTNQLVISPTLNALLIVEQHTYNQCPVCGFPLSMNSAICPRCGNDILEDISSLDQQSLERYHKHLENKKAEWYARCLTDQITGGDNPPLSAEHQECPAGRQKPHALFNSDDELAFFTSLNRADILRDTNLRKKWWQSITADWQDVVRFTLKINHDPSDSDLLAFFDSTNLRCDDRRIHSLLPIRVLEKLQQLRCDESPIESLEPLAHLTLLQRLYAFDCDFTSLEPLRNLTHLKLLWISSTEITSLEPISNLINLEELYCSETDITDLEPLRKLINLEKLSCYKTSITSLEPLAELENLIELGINHSDINDLTPLAGLINLEYLRCSKTAISSLEPLRNMVELRELSIAHTNVDSLEGLQGLENLEELDITNTLVSSIEPLMGLEYIEKLELSVGTIPDEELERFVELHPDCNVVAK